MVYSLLVIDVNQVDHILDRILSVTILFFPFWSGGGWVGASMYGNLYLKVIACIDKK